ncbi:putative bifunctional diguanylate cyclase/phosphodiesterase [Peptoclostridium litorale]|nr:GGDEF domain-containing phosphodiesterase [Peptoclostridium litorale]
MESIFLIYYYNKFGYIDTIEKMLLPILIALVWFLGKNYDELQFYSQKASENEKELQQIFDNIDVALWSFDVDENVAMVSAGIEKIFGVPRQKFRENPRYWRSLVHPKDKLLIEEKLGQLYSGKSVTTVYRIIKGDGEVCWIKDRSTPNMDSCGNVIKINGVLSDITDLKSSEEKNEYLAYYDVLTSLPNRNMLYDKFNEILAGYGDSDQNISVIFFDLDFFKMINDTMGHSTGDVVLQNVSRKLNRCLCEYGFLSRYGGDEFIIMLKDVGRERASKIAECILEEMSHPVKVEDCEIFLSASIGISVYPMHGSDIDTLVKCADTAMHFAKERGRNHYQLYTPDQGKRVGKKMMLANGLRTALANDEFFLQYQPQFNLETSEIVGVEALIRWRHPEFGLISPAEFIPVAEETGIIVDIGKWVLKTACKQNKEWQEAGLPNVNMAVNVSVKQFQHRDFIKGIKKVLTETRLDSRYLELEMTESIMQNSEYLHGVLSELREMGVKLSMDDFGTGYSSLSLLRYLPIDNLKIDKSFIDGIQVDENAVSIIKTIIDMGMNLNMNIIAEGVENKEQAIFLKKNNCNLAQGYLFSKPLPAGKIRRILEGRVVGNHKVI